MIAPERRVIAFVGCCAEKLPYRARARDLYLSPLFRWSLAYAWECVGADEIFILSAAHGVVGLDQELEPYDLSLQEMGAAERRLWRAHVHYQVSDHLGAALGLSILTDPHCFDHRPPGTALRHQMKVHIDHPDEEMAEFAKELEAIWR